MRTRWVVVTLMLAVGLCAQAAEPRCDGITASQTPTLAELFAAQCLPAPPAAHARADRPITSFAQLRTADEFVLAYYVTMSTGALQPPLRLLRFDLRRRQWSHGELKVATTRLFELGDVDCLGSAMSIHQAGAHLAISTHLSPSAGCTLVLDRAFTLKQALPGWPVAFSKKGAFVFEESMVHFAPTHPMRLWLYEPQRGRQTFLYPPQPDPLGQAYRDRLFKDIPPKDRCDTLPNAEALCAFDERFESGTSPERVAIDDDTGAVALTASFSPEGYLRPTADQRPWREQVTYVFRQRAGAVEFRQFKADTNPRPLAELATTKGLGELFTTSP